MEVADAALLHAAMRRMPSRTACEIASVSNAFQTVIGPQIVLLRRKTRDPTACMNYIVRAAQWFLELKRSLVSAERHLAVHSGEGTCLVCQEKFPADQLPCCRAGMHAHCWVAWRLTLPEECPACRRHTSS